MDLTSEKEIRCILDQRQLRPSKALGQNFLIDRGAVEKIVEAAELSPQDIVLEIGPGLGVLTRELAKRAKKVVALEKDRAMVEILKETLDGLKNVEVINQDARFLKPAAKEYKIVGNLPFYLTAPLIRQFLEAEQKPKTMTLVVQKEMGQRICAKTPDMNILAVSVQFYSKPEIVSYIPKESFWPAPEVDTCVIKITPLAKPVLTEKTDLFFKIMKAGFSQPRKQLINNLSKKLGIKKDKAGEWLLKQGLQPNQRAETLELEDWARLTNSADALN